VLFAIVAATVAWLYNGVTYATGIGEQRTIRLPDSSLVDLNACSVIKVRFSRNMRTVQLVEGQALFHVAKDTHRPFIVHSGGLAVRAVGTEFDVYRKRTGTVVTVLEGRVAIEGRDREGDVSPTSPPEATLSAGEQLTVTNAITTLRPRLADVSAATAWTQRRFVFEDTPLADVAEEFNRYSARRLIIEDPELARQQISGIYSSTNPSPLIGFLSAQPQLEVTETEHEIRVKRR
jgi:transmembrane sensor